MCQETKPRRKIYGFFNLYYLGRNVLEFNNELVQGTGSY
jgi:hypothetical protein